MTRLLLDVSSLARWTGPPVGITRVEPANVRVSSEPPLRIRGKARWATSVKEKAEITIVRQKLPRVVASMYRPFNSLRSEKPMAWTTKSSPPHLPRIASKHASTDARSSTSQGSVIVDPRLSASGFTRRPSASP